MSLCALGAFGSMCFFCGSWCVVVLGLWWVLAGGVWGFVAVCGWWGLVETVMQTVVLCQSAECRLWSYGAMGL